MPQALLIRSIHHHISISTFQFSIYFYLSQIMVDTSGVGPHVVAPSYSLSTPPNPIPITPTNTPSLLSIEYRTKQKEADKNGSNKQKDSGIEVINTKEDSMT